MNNLFSSEEHWRDWIRQNPQYEGTLGAPVGEFLRRVVDGEFRLQSEDAVE